MTPTQQQDKAKKADQSTAEANVATKAADDADPKSDAASSDTPPRDPSQAIPDIALQRYLDPRVAGDYSNPQL